MSYPQNLATAFAIHPPLSLPAEAPPLFLVVDLFCGFGGVTRGFSLAKIGEWHLAKVIACVNHDENAIASHRANHPEVAHFREDIRKLNLTELRDVVRRWQVLYPNAYLILWGSPDCTHHSKAKGGKSRNADSRTLAKHLRRYVKILNPDYIMVENVTDFRSWGPLIIRVERHKEDVGNGRKVIAASCPLVWDEETETFGPKWVPEARTKGRDFLRWIESLKRCGYDYADRDLNAADFGAFTSRNRYYGIFAKKGLPIAWPRATHARNPTQNGLFGDLLPWRGVREKLDLHDQGKSIFTPGELPCEKTLERIYAGLVKFVAGGDNGFIQQYFSGEPSGKVQSLDGPCPTITTKDHNGAVFIIKYNSTSANGKVSSGNSIDDPAPTVTVQHRLGLVSAEFLVKTFGVSSKSDGAFSVEKPAGTLTTKDGLHVVQAEFLMQSNGGDPAAKVYPLDRPARTITTHDNQAVVQTDFLISYYGNSQPRSLEEPCPTIPTHDRFATVRSEFFLDKQYGGSQQYNNQSIEVPAGTLTINPKLNLVEAQFIADLRFENAGFSIDRPGQTLLTGNHAYLITTIEGEAAIVLYPDDSPALRRIKLFMAAYGIIDIKKRMLRIKELLRIQGFPDDYAMVGTQEEHKKFIGNSVEPTQVTALTLGLAAPLLPSVAAAQAA